jgi:choline transport protein
MSIFGWWLAGASIANFIAAMTLAIVTLWYPDYEIKSWHQWLVYVGIIWLAVALNVFGSRLIPIYNQFIFVLAVLTLSVTTVVLLVCNRNNYPSASWIFTDTTNLTGWPSDGFAFMLSISNAVYSFLGTDCGAHLCEEIHNPGLNVPKIILYPIVIGLITAFPFAIACMASITDLDSVLGTSTGKSNTSKFAFMGFQVLMSF